MSLQEQYPPDNHPLGQLRTHFKKLSKADRTEFDRLLLFGWAWDAQARVIGWKWLEDSSLEKWFPYANETRLRLREDNVKLKKEISLLREQLKDALTGESTIKITVDEAYLVLSLMAALPNPPQNDEDKECATLGDRLYAEAERINAEREPTKAPSDKQISKAQADVINNYLSKSGFDRDAAMGHIRGAYRKDEFEFLTVTEMNGLFDFLRNLR